MGFVPRFAIEPELESSGNPHLDVAAAAAPSTVD